VIVVYRCSGPTKPKCCDGQASLASWDYLKKRFKVKGSKCWHASAICKRLARHVGMAAQTHCSSSLLTVMPKNRHWMYLKKKLMAHLQRFWIIDNWSRQALIHAHLQCSSSCATFDHPVLCLLSEQHIKELTTIYQAAGSRKSGYLGGQSWVKGSIRPKIPAQTWWPRLKGIQYSGKRHFMFFNPHKSPPPGLR